MRFFRIPIRFLRYRWVLMLWGTLALLIGSKLLRQRGACLDAAAWHAMDIRSNQVLAQLNQFSDQDVSQIRAGLSPGQQIQVSSQNAMGPPRLFYVDEVYKMTDPQTDVLFYLCFSNGKMVSIRFFHHRESRFAGPIAGGWLAGKNQQEALVTITVAWCLLLLTAIAVWRFHRAVGQVLLALGILCTFVSLLDPRYSRVFIDQPLSSGWTQTGILLITLSILIIALPHWHRRAGEAGARCCAHCGYNLTGNVSGICPECGKPNPEFRHRQEAERLAEIAVETAPDNEEAIEPDLPDSSANV